MESHDVQLFEDPTLKRAIRRCCAGECASSRLKERLVERMRGEIHERGGGLTAGLSTTTIQLGLSARTMPAMKLTPAARVGVEAAATRGLSFGAMWPGFAVAAMFAVSVGTIILSYSSSSPSNNTSLAFALPADF